MSKFDSLVDTIYKSTLSGNLNWKLKNYSFNSETSHRFISESSDGKTKFEINIDLSSDLKSLYGGLYWVKVINPDISRDGIMLYNTEHVEIKKIHEYIFENKIKPTLRNINQDSAIEDIIKSIDVSGYRDDKINTILGSESVPKKIKSKSVVALSSEYSSEYSSDKNLKLINKLKRQVFTLVFLLITSLILLLLK